MPKKKLHKSLQDYLSKIKNKPTPNLQNPKKFILSGCKHPMTRSFAVDRTRIDDATNKDDGAALADIDRFLLENFKSLYLRDEDSTYCNSNVAKDKKGKGSNVIPVDKESCAGGILFDSPRFLEPPRDLCGSARFFVGPGSSSSLMEEARSSTTSTAGAATTTTTATTITVATTSGMSFTESMADNDSMSDCQNEVKLPDDCIAVLAHSSLPNEDFRRSMREMVDARLRSHGQVDWEFMEELLFCYLNLNEKKSHKYILNAFVDLIVALRRSNGRPLVRHQEPGRVARGTRRRRTRREIVT
ncbi:transcription repressor OFP14 [Punica granatum]|uniref:Transcription repressor n=2 Tax=Punica granatum TaxID=22663 RepID=A0A218X033_PUNGR|nr:transcription repressor OFP14 [Punica granatum]OWM78188.1 hypothetical protein CDL15_Pgr015007 [Punica granatum]PKI47841.1 hypothetical protein CRG98_031802 [Punica granatum]